MTVKVQYILEKATFYDYISDIDTVLGSKQSLTVLSMVKLTWLTSASLSSQAKTAIFFF